MTTPNSAFQVRDFRLVTQARFLFALAVQMQALVMGWQIYEIKHDPLYLGLIGLTEALPALSLALISGYIVDKSNPLKVYKNVVRLSLVSALILLIISLPRSWTWIGMGLTPDERLPWIYVAALITGTARGFAGPSLYSLIPQLIPRSTFNVSSAWITSAGHIASVIGPALGGLLYALPGVMAGPLIPYGADTAFLLGALLSLTLIRHKAKTVQLPVREPILRSLTSGIRFVFGHQLLLSALAMDMFAVLFGGVTSILPIFAAEILRVGPTGLGLLRASPAAGALVMSAILIRRPITHSAGKILLAVVTGFGLCIIGFALSKIYLMSFVLLALSGALDSVSMVIRSAIVQLCSPDEMRGRIAAVNSIFIGSSNELGAFESGLAARLMGTVPSVVFGGIMTLLTVAATLKLAPKLRNMDVSKI